MKILITGGKGQLANELAEKSPRNKYIIAAYDHYTLDITQPSLIENVFQTFHPDLVINTAAYTATDKAEQEQEMAFRVNRDGAKNIAQACSLAKIPLIHVSTDYVFAGNQEKPYREEDQTAPINIYGQSKWEGEQAVRENCEQHIILRVSGLFSSYGNNFVKKILRLAREKKTLKMIADQITCPTYAGDIALTIWEIIDKQGAIQQAGTYHYCNNEPVSWYQFAFSILQHAAYTDIDIQPVPSAEFPTPALRPAYSVLDCSKISNTFNIQLHSWRPGLQHVIKNLHYD